MGLGALATYKSPSGPTFTPVAMLAGGCGNGSTAMGSMPWSRLMRTMMPRVSETYRLPSGCDVIDSGRFKAGSNLADCRIFGLKTKLNMRAPFS